MRQEYIFHEGDLPSGYRYVFPVAVYNNPAYRALQSATGWVSFYILWPKDLTIHGQIHFYLRDGLAESPLRAPFGSVEISSLLPADILFGFLAFAESRLIGAGVSKIVIKNPPDAYYPETAGLLHTFFLNHGYNILDAEVGSIISVSEETFSNLIHPRKKRKLKQSRTNLLRFAHLGRNSLRDVYQFISDSRVARKYKLSITLHDLRDTLEQFPEAYQLFAVYYEEKLVAASVAIKVNEKVLYHFISDHTRKIDSFCPGLILMEGIYNYCFEQNLQILDLGTSAVNGKPDFKLLKFKTELGGKPTAKFTFIKNVA